MGTEKSIIWQAYDTDLQEVVTESEDYSEVINNTLDYLDNECGVIDESCTRIYVQDFLEHENETPEDCGVNIVIRKKE